jgi:REP element-mobilizing transposase RayT
MPYTRIWIHCVWSTKNREHLLTQNIRQLIFKHIKETAKQKDIFIDFINGYSDHVHVLISLGNDQTISNVMKLIKGESSQWINKNRMIPGYFNWQDGYFAASVSHSDVIIVRNYIRYQTRHHHDVSWDFEIRCLLDENGFERFEDPE